MNEPDQLASSFTPDLFGGSAHGGKGWCQVGRHTLVVEANDRDIIRNKYPGLVESGQDAHGSLVVAREDSIKSNPMVDQVTDGGLGNIAVKFTRNHQVRVERDAMCVQRLPVSQLAPA